jgi:cystathionine beta-synthase
MREFPTVLDLVGNTPIVRLPALQPPDGARLLAKLEYLNPGGSIKDRIGLPMIEAAERDGLLKPGGVIVEPTSGNTGVGLAMVAAQRGYRCIFVMPDKMSQEKISLLRAFGADVVMCPTNVEPDDPASYYSVSKRLTEETPGAFNPNQYANQANPAAHYEHTGPEIWEQVGDDLDALVLGVGTGGTATGIGRYLKERKPALQVIGADPEGSIYSSRVVKPYLVEGVGEDFWPATFDPEVVDRWISVSDRDSFHAARLMARTEGILVGGSSGLALHAALAVAAELPPEKTVLVLIPDGGRPYLSKVFNDEWLREHGMLERPAPTATVAQLLRAKQIEEPSIPSVVSVSADQRVGEAIELLQRYGISQIPVMANGDCFPCSLDQIVGSVLERELLDRVIRDGADALQLPVAEAMAPPLRVIRSEQQIEEIYGDLQAQPAVVVADGGTAAGVLTRTDLLEFLAHRS